MSGSAKFWPLASASPEPSRTRQSPLTGIRVRGTATMNDFAVRSTVSLPPLARTSVRTPVTGLISHAPRLETTSAWSIPGELTPAPAGHCEAPVAGVVVGVERPLGDRHIGIGERHPIHTPIAVVALQTDTGAEDVGTVVVGRPGRDRRSPPGAPPALNSGCSWCGQPLETRRPVIVVDEVGPQGGAAGQAAGS